MPLLARMIPAPLFIDVRRDAVAGLSALLADRRIATEGRVAVAVGPGQGDSIAEELELGSGELFRVSDGTVDTAVRLGKRLRCGSSRRRLARSNTSRAEVPSGSPCPLRSWSISAGCAPRPRGLSGPASVMW